MHESTPSYMYDMAIAVVHVCLEYAQERKAAGSDWGRLRLLQGSLLLWHARKNLQGFPGLQNPKPLLHCLRQEYSYCEQKCKKDSPFFMIFLIFIEELMGVMIEYYWFFFYRTQ